MTELPIPRRAGQKSYWVRVKGQNDVDEMIGFLSPEDAAKAYYSTAYKESGSCGDLVLIVSDGSGSEWVYEVGCTIVHRHNVALIGGRAGG